MGIREELKKATEELERAMIESLVSQFPTYELNDFQKRMFQSVQDLSGFTLSQDKTKMALSLGAPSLSSYKGCFSQARYNPRLENDYIFMNTDTSDPYWYSVLIHEMAHATGVPKYLGRIGLNGLEKDMFDYCVEEIIAETTASLIMERFGYATETTRQTNKAYIASYEAAAALYGPMLNKKIDQYHIDTEVKRAKELVLHWFREFDSMNTEVVSERVKEFNRFF